MFKFVNCLYLMAIKILICELFRSNAENRAAEKRAVDSLRQECDQHRKTIADLKLQKDHLAQEVVIANNEICTIFINP